MTINENNNRKLGTIQVNLLTNGSDLMNGDSNLISVDCPFPALINGTRMFYKCSALQAFATNYDNDEKDKHMSFDKLQTGTRMFQGCTSLTRIESRTPSLTHVQHMFRDCTSLTEDQFIVENIQDNLFDGLCMFQNTSFSSIPWTFPNLERCKQMFMDTKITGHLSLSMPTQFPKVTEYDTSSYMFGNCSITSLDFDVSTVDNGNSMFNLCHNLTTCTGAKFKQGGDYQSMFPHSIFAETSAELIYSKAMEAQVTHLHIGVGFQITETHEFATKHNLSMLDDDQSGRQWRNPENTVVFVCNTTQNQNVSIINNDDYPPIID